MTPADDHHVTLASGVTIPQVGFGTFQIPPEETQAAVEHALGYGYRHIDTAAAYNNEAGVGAALRGSGLARDDIFVTTKLRNGEQGHDAALRAFDDSRQRLGVDVVDLYLVHWPVPSKDLYVETWRALAEIKESGAVRAIGVSNFLPEHLQRLADETGVLPDVNQIEVHPTFQQRATLEATRTAGIAVEAYSPLGQGADLQSEEVAELADAHGVTPGQIVLRWHVQHGHIVIPKSVNPARIEANLDLFRFELTADEMAVLDAMDSEDRVGGDPAVFDRSQIRA
ncbi:aldo/keto reductase [Georgenia sp. Z1344]|uniref:aldo/keto reductase n=1 Tax=Georgenia sp. Z1344 TaxID=3416706 RepID=UPI003CF06381